MCFFMNAVSGSSQPNSIKRFWTGWVGTAPREVETNKSDAISARVDMVRELYSRRIVFSCGSYSLSGGRKPVRPRAGSRPRLSQGSQRACDIEQRPGYTQGRMGSVLVWSLVLVGLLLVLFVAVAQFKKRLVKPDDG